MLSLVFFVVLLLVLFCRGWRFCWWLVLCLVVVLLVFCVVVAVVFLLCFGWCFLWWCFCCGGVVAGVHCGGGVGGVVTVVAGICLR